MSNQEQERLDLIDKFKRLEPFYYQYMVKNQSVRAYQYNLTERDRNRQSIHNLKQHIESENLEEKAKLVNKIVRKGNVRSKYVLFRSIPLLLILYGLLLNFFEPFITTSYSVYLSVLILIGLLSIYLPLYYYNKEYATPYGTLPSNIRCFIVGAFVAFCVIGQYIDSNWKSYGILEVLFHVYSIYIIAVIIIQIICLTFLGKKIESDPLYSIGYDDGSLGNTIRLDYMHSINALRKAQEEFEHHDDICKKYEAENIVSIYENILNHPMYQEIKDSIPEYYLRSRYTEVPMVTPLWLSEILTILQAGRADTLKEAINVKISDDDRNKMLDKIQAAESAANSARSRAIQAELDAARARDEARNAQNAADAANRRASDAEWRANQSYYRP